MITTGSPTPKSGDPNFFPKPSENHFDQMYHNCIKALQKKAMYRMPEEDSDLRQVIRNVGFFHNVLSGEDYEIFIKEFGEQLSLKTVSPGKTVYHKGEFDDHFYLILKGTVVMYREDTSHSIYESEEFKYADEKEEENKTESKEPMKTKNNAALRDLDLLMSDKSKKHDGTLEAMGVPDFREFDPEKFDVGVSKFIYLMAKYDPKKSKVDPYGPEVDEETKFFYDYSLLFYAQIERPDKYYRAGKFHFRPVRRLRRGEYFGEAGMIVSQPRTETAIAADEVIVAYIPRKKTLSHFHQIMEIIEYRMKYLIPFFKVINHVYVVKLCAAMREEFYDHGTTVFTQGSRLSGFFILISGEVEIVKDITVNKYLINDPRSMHSDKTRRYLIDTIKDGQIFGEDDLLFEKAMSYTAIVKSTTIQVIRMTAKVFDTFFKTYPYIFDDLYVMASLRRKNREGKVALIKMPSSVNERKKYLYISAIQPGQSKEYIEKIVHMQEEEKKDENQKPKFKIPKPRLKSFFSRLQVPKYLEKMKDVLHTHKSKRIIPLVSVILDLKEPEPEPVFKFEMFKRDSGRTSKKSVGNSELVKTHQNSSSKPNSVAPSLQNLDVVSSQKLEERLSKNEQDPFLNQDPIINAVAKAVKHHIEVHDEIQEDEESSDNSIDMELKENSNTNIKQLSESPKFEPSPLPGNIDQSSFSKNDETFNDDSKEKITQFIQGLETPNTERKKGKLPTIVSPITRRVETEPEESQKLSYHLRLNSLLRNSYPMEETDELYSALRKKYDEMVSPKSSRLFKLTSLPHNNSQSSNTENMISRVESYHSATQNYNNPLSPLTPKLKPKIMLSPRSVKRELDFGPSPKKKKVPDLRLTITLKKEKF